VKWLVLIIPVNMVSSMMSLKTIM